MQLRLRVPRTCAGRARKNAEQLGGCSLATQSSKKAQRKRKEVSAQSRQAVAHPLLVSSLTCVVAGWLVVQVD